MKLNEIVGLLRAVRLGDASGGVPHPYPIIGPTEQGYLAKVGVWRVQDRLAKARAIVSFMQSHKPSRCFFCKLDPQQPEHRGRVLYECEVCDTLVCSNCSSSGPANTVLCQTCTTMPPEEGVATKFLGTAGDACTPGNECGRLGCPECQA